MCARLYSWFLYMLAAGKAHGNRNAAHTLPTDEKPPPTAPMMMRCFLCVSAHTSMHTLRVCVCVCVHFQTKKNHNFPLPVSQSETILVGTYSTCLCCVCSILCAVELNVAQCHERKSPHAHTHKHVQAQPIQMRICIFVMHSSLCV